MQYARHRHDFQWHTGGCHHQGPSREVPISWSSIARIWACADMAAVERAGGRLIGRGWGAERALAGGGGGDEGKGWGSCGAVSVAAAASRPASGETEGSRECPGCAPHDGVDAEGGSTLESEPSRPRSPSGS